MLSPVKPVLGLCLSLLLMACTPPEERAANYMSKAQAAYASGDYVTAKLEARNALQVAPKNAEGRYLMALLAEQDQEVQAVYGHLLVAIDSDPDYVDARLKLGNLLFRSQAWEQAQEQLDALLKLAPDNPDVLLLQARLQLQKRDTDAAIATIDRAVALSPDDAEALAFQASVKSINDVDQGLAVLDQAIPRLPAAKARALRELRIRMLTQAKRTGDAEKDLQALAHDFPEGNYDVDLARFYSEQGRLEDADQAMQAVVKRDPDDAVKRIAYAEFLANERDPDKAETALKAFIKETPEADSLRLALGRLYEASNRLPEATTTYQAIVERDSGNKGKSKDALEARLRLAGIDLRTGKTAEARQLVDGILADVPDQAGALLIRASLKLNDQQYDDAVGDLRLVLRQIPEEQQALQLIAEAYTQKGDRVLAKDAWRDLLRIRPDSPQALRGLALLLAGDGDFSESEALLRQRLAAAPDDATSSAALVEVLLEQKKYQPAAEEARRLAALPDQAAGQPPGQPGELAGVGEQLLARVLTQQKDYNGAVEAWRRALAARPDQNAALDGLVRALVAAGKSREAISLLTPMAEADTTGSSEAGKERALYARYLLGDTYRQTGNGNLARQNLEAVIDKAPRTVDAYLSLAGVADQDAEARVAVYRRGLQAVPGNQRLGMLLAAELSALGQREAAIAAYEDLLKANPDFAPAINNLAATLLENPDDKASIDRAVALAQRLQRTEDPVQLDTLGWAYYHAGRPGEAVQILERVVAKADRQPIFRYHLGMAYLAMGNSVGAEQQLSEALKGANVRFDGVEDARSALKKLKAG